MKKLNTEKLKPVTSRFIEKVTTMTALRGKYTKFNVNKAENGIKYSFNSPNRFHTESIKIGDVVLIAKLRHTHKRFDYVWDVYKITIPGYVYNHNGVEQLLPQTWFGRTTYLVY